ncbi:hypothetical protein D3C80_1394570 [compost metagenome]
MHRHLHLTQLHQQAFRQGQHTGLGHVVVAHARALHQCGHRGDVDNAPLAALQQRQEGLATLDHAHQIDRDLPVPVFQRQFGEEPARSDAGVVDDHIDPTELLFAGLGQGRQLAIVAHIAALDEAVATGLANLLQRFAQAGFVDIGQCQAPALTGPAQGDLAAEARPGAGDHDAFLHGRRPCFDREYGESNQGVAIREDSSGQ